MESLLLGVALVLVSFVYMFSSPTPQHVAAADDTHI